MKIKRKYCRHCKDYRKFERHGANHLFHLVATMIMMGAWLVVWLFVAMVGGRRFCSVCGGR